MVIFDRVFVPHEQIFMNGEVEATDPVILRRCQLVPVRKCKSAKIKEKLSRHDSCNRVRGEAATRFQQLTREDPPIGALRTAPPAGNNSKFFYHRSEALQAPRHNGGGQTEGSWPRSGQDHRQHVASRPPRGRGASLPQRRGLRLPWYPSGPVALSPSLLTGVSAGWVAVLTGLHQPGVAQAGRPRPASVCFAPAAGGCARRCALRRSPAQPERHCELCSAV